MKLLINQEVADEMRCCVDTMLARARRVSFSAKKPVKSYRLLTVATWVLSSGAALLKKWLPPPVKTFCWKMRLRLTTSFSSATAWLVNRLIAWLLRWLILPALHYIAMNLRSGGIATGIVKF